MKKYIASVSWGKDSTAMLLMLIKHKLPLDEVVFYDTGMEFDAIYQTRDLMLKRFLIPLGIKYVEIKPDKPFLYYMLEIPRVDGIKGFGWCGGKCRWATSQKVNAIDNYNKDAIWYIGIASDELERLNRLPSNKKAPLAIMGITEKQALKICYDNGFYFGGLYKILKRVSCWCCRNKNLDELANYKKYLPEYFNKLVELEHKIGECMKPPWSLTTRFDDEIAR